MVLSFVGFDGNSYNIERVMPDSFFLYNYYILFSDRSGNMRLICFNDEIIIKPGDNNNIVISCSDATSFRRFATNAIAGGWEDVGLYNEYSKLGMGYIPIYSSENLFNYKDSIMSYNFVFPVPEIEAGITAYTLRPIVEEVDKNDNIVDSSFNEIFSILPVLIVVLIGFIGIRKAINFLFSLLRRS